MYKIVIWEDKQHDIHPSPAQPEGLCISCYLPRSFRMNFFLDHPLFHCILQGFLLFLTTPSKTSVIKAQSRREVYGLTSQNTSIQSQAVHAKSTGWQEKKGDTIGTWTNKDQPPFTLWDCSLTGGMAMPNKWSCLLDALKRVDFTLKDSNARHLLLILTADNLLGIGSMEEINVQWDKCNWKPIRYVAALLPLGCENKRSKQYSISNN